MAVIFQAELRRFLELLGRGQILQLLKPQSSSPKADNLIDEMVDAVKELSQNRIGALIVVETFGTLDHKLFVNQGVKLNGEVSKELLQTIFQPKTLLHDGAVFIRGSRIMAAGVILPLSERTALDNWELVTERRWELPNGAKIVFVWWFLKKQGRLLSQKMEISIVP